MNEKPHLSPQELTDKIIAQMHKVDTPDSPIDEDEMSGDSGYRRAIALMREREAEQAQQDTEQNPNS
jgi:hypothetical protein